MPPVHCRATLERFGLGARKVNMRTKSMLRAVWLAATLTAVAAVHAGEAQVQRPGYVLQAEQAGSGALTVVFESGFGQGPGVWKAVVAELGDACQCVVYARAGLGKSGSDGRPKTIQAHLDDLGAVVDALAPGRNVVLVGHSYGGLLVTEFARRHPERVAALVLVDPATMGQRHAFKAADRKRVLADDKALLGMLPPAMGADYRLLIKQLDAPEAKAARPMPDVPVAVLTSTQVAAEPMVFEETAQGKALWRAQHAALFAAFSRGSHAYFATGHNIHRENPKAVADAIRAVAPAPASTSAKP
jgi:pimeloyl-ACP methyl ester carboxylesterase